MEKEKAFKVSTKVRVKGFELKSWWGWNFVKHTSGGVMRGINANEKPRIQFAWQKRQRWIEKPLT